MTDKIYKILHVEDNELFITMIKLMLNDDIFLIDSVNDGSDAIDKVSNNNYDIILMDVFMTNMDGKTASKIIKNIKPDSIIICLSACELSDLINYPYFDYVLQKPVTKQILRDTIFKILK